MRTENETIRMPEVRKSQTGNASTSFLLLTEDFAAQRTFRCLTNNSLGMGQWCEIDVAGEYYNSSTVGCSSTFTHKCILCVNVCEMYL